MEENNWILPVEQVDDEFLLTFPPELMEQLPGWEPGVTLIWTKQEDQSWVVSLEPPYEPTSRTLDPPTEAADEV